MELTLTALRIFTILLNVFTIGVLVWGIKEYGWNNRNLVTIFLLVLSFTLLLIGALT